MNAKYIAKNPSPVPQTITLPQGLSLDGGRLRSSRAITVQVPPMSVREILFDEDGNPMSEGCIQDLNVTTEHEDGTPIDPHQNRRERTRIVDASGDRTTVFFDEARRIYPTLLVDDNRFLGGAQLLAQFSHLRSARDNTTAIYSPAALNMTYESRTDSLYHAASTGQVEIQSIIGNGFDQADAVSMRVHNPSSDTVRGRPRGTMVEQQTWTSKQNLVVKEDVWIEIEPGQTGNFLCPPSAPTQAVAAPAASP